MSFYADMRDNLVRELLKPDAQGGFGQGVLQLNRITAGVPDPDKPWNEVLPTKTSEIVNGAVSGIGEKLIGVEVNGVVLVASDLEAICEVPVFKYTAGDTMTIDGKEVQIIAVKRIPEAGTTVAVKFYLRG